MSDLGKAVFLSYASQDAAAAKLVCAALRAAGVEVWFDQSELVGGDQWDAKIRGQIGSCALFMPIISANTQARLEGYFRLEWKLAAQRTHTMADEKTFLLPVVIDATRDPEARVPGEFKSVQWTKLPAGETPPAFVERVKKLLSGELGAGGKESGVGASLDDARGRRPAAPLHKPGVNKWWWALPIFGVTMALLLVLKESRKEPAPALSPPAVNASNPSNGPMSIPAAAAPAAAVTMVEFPRDPELKRAVKLIYSLDVIEADFALAEDIVKPVLVARPNDPEVVTIAAEVAQEYLTRGFDTSDARRSVVQKLAERAVQLAPDNPDALAALSRYLAYMSTQLPRAEQLVRRAIELRPDESRYYRNLLEVLVRDKRGPEVEAFLAQMAARFPADALVRYDLARSYKDRNDVAAMEKALDETLALGPVANAIVWKGWIMLGVHGDMAGMKAALDRVPGRQRPNARVAIAFSTYGCISGDTAPAIKLLEDLPDPWLNDFGFSRPKVLLLGELYAVSGRKDLARLQYEAAIAEIKRMEAANPTDLRLRIAEMWTLLGLERREEAHAVLLLVLESYARPYGATINDFWWGGPIRASLLLGERGQALTLLKEAVVNPQSRLLLRNNFKVDPRMAPFRDDAEISALLAEPGEQKTEDRGQKSEVGAPIDQKSVAVLAFANLSDDKANEYFSDGISEELLNVLCKVRGLKVSARTSSFHFKGKDTSIPEIAKALGVAYVIEGSVRKSGDKVRITAQLIKAADGFHVWSDTFTRDLKDIFAVQDEIAGLIAKNLELRLGAGGATTAVNPQAFELYVQARQAWNQRNAAGFARAAELLDRALELAPDFARAHAARADVWVGQAQNQGTIGGSSQRDSPEMQKAFAEIQRALALEPESAEAHAALGNTFLNTWRQAEAIREFRRAIELNPNYASAHHWLGRALWLDGRIDEAGTELHRAAGLDPLSHRILDNNAAYEFGVGHYATALALNERALALQPDALQAATFMIRDLSALGRHDEAVAQVRRWGIDRVEGYELFAVEAFVQAGRKREAEEVFARLPGNELYWGHLLLGRQEQALAALATAELGLGDGSEILLAPLFDPIRGDPRFRRKLADLGLTEAHARAQAWRAAHPPEKPAAKK